MLQDHAFKDRLHNFLFLGREASDCLELQSQIIVRAAFILAEEQVVGTDAESLRQSLDDIERGLRSSALVAFQLSDAAVHQSAERLLSPTAFFPQFDQALGETDFRVTVVTVLVPTLHVVSINKAAKLVDRDSLHMVRTIYHKSASGLEVLGVPGKGPQKGAPMAYIPDEEVERLKREVSLERLAEARGIKLKRHGKELLGLCPFHNDRNPSLCIDPVKNLWHGIGACGAGGEVIKWVRKAEGVSFRHACELLRNEVPLTAKPAGAVVKESTVPKLPPLFGPTAGDQAVLGIVVSYYHETLKN